MQSSRRFDEILIVDHPEKMSCAPARTSHFGEVCRKEKREQSFLLMRSQSFHAE